MRDVKKIHVESRMTFWLRHLLNRMRSGRIAHDSMRLCAFPDDLIGREMAVAGTYEASGIDAMRWLCESGIVESPESSVFLDIGANVGIYTARMASKFMQVIAFEPHPVVRKVLDLNVDINDLRNVIVSPYGLSDIDGVAELSEGSAGNIGASSLERTNAGNRKVEVRLQRGDGLIREITASKISLVKIDVEGHEPRVISGMEKILREDGPIVAFEANDDSHNQALMDYLGGLGYVKFLALDWHPSAPWLWLRVLLLTCFGVGAVLKPVANIENAKYSLVFAMTKSAAQRWERSVGGFR